MYTLGDFTLHFYAISVSSLCFLVSTQYVSHHKNFNVLVHVEVPVTGHDVFGGKLHWKCININPFLRKMSKKRYMSLRLFVRKHGW